MVEHKTFNNIIWNGWIYLSIPFKVIISDMTAFKVKEIYYKLIMYFDAWNKELVGLSRTETPIDNQLMNHLMVGLKKNS